MIRGIKKKEIKNEIKKLLRLVNLVDARKKKIGALSGGMKRRLGLAQAMIGSPALLIVDEPTAGVDPEERVKIRQLLSDYAMNHIVLMSTHIVEDIAHICEKVIIQEKGRTRFKGDIKDLINEATEHLGEKYFPSLKEFQEYAKENDVISFYRAGQNVRAIIKSESGKLKSEIGLEDAYMWSIKG